MNQGGPAAPAEPYKYFNVKFDPGANRYTITPEEKPSTKITFIDTSTGNIYSGDTHGDIYEAVRINEKRRIPYIKDADGFYVNGKFVDRTPERNEVSPDALIEAAREAKAPWVDFTAHINGKDRDFTGRLTDLDADHYRVELRDGRVKTIAKDRVTIHQNESAGQNGQTDESQNAGTPGGIVGTGQGLPPAGSGDQAAHGATAGSGGSGDAAGSGSGVGAGETTKPPLPPLRRPTGDASGGTGTGQPGGGGSGSGSGSAAGTVEKPAAPVDLSKVDWDAEAKWLDEQTGVTPSPKEEKTARPSPSKKRQIGQRSPRPTPGPEKGSLEKDLQEKEAAAGTHQAAVDDAVQDLLNLLNEPAPPQYAVAPGGKASPVSTDRKTALQSAANKIVIAHLKLTGSQSAGATAKFSDLMEGVYRKFGEEALLQVAPHIESAWNLYQARQFPLDEPTPVHSIIQGLKEQSNGPTTQQPQPGGNQNPADLGSAAARGRCSNSASRANSGSGWRRWRRLWKRAARCISRREWTRSRRSRRR